MTTSKHDFLNNQIELFKSKKFPLVHYEILTEEDEYVLDNFFNEPDYLVNVEKTLSTENKLSLFFDEPTTWKYDFKTKTFKVTIESTQEQFTLNKEYWGYLLGTIQITYNPVKSTITGSKLIIINFLKYLQSKNIKFTIKELF